MAWDATFDWADASSFSGEARKYDILAEMIVQLNNKATCVSAGYLAAAVKGNPLGILIDFDSKFDTLVPLFYDHIADNGSKWTLAKLETEIGASRPAPTSGGAFTPTWINWMYQAIVLLQWITYSHWYTMTFSGSTMTACYKVGGSLDPACPCSNGFYNMDSTLSRGFSGTYTYPIAPGGYSDIYIQSYSGYTTDGSTIYAKTSFDMTGGYPNLYIGLSVKIAGSSAYNFPTLRYRNTILTDFTVPMILPYYRKYGATCVDTTPGSVTVTPHQATTSCT